MNIIKSIVSFVIVVTVLAGSTPQNIKACDETAQINMTNGVIVTLRPNGKLPNSNGKEIFQDMYAIEKITEQELAKLQKETQIKSIQPVFQYKTCDNESVDETIQIDSQKQWGLYNDGTKTDDMGEVIAKEGIDIGVKKAWEKFQSQEQVLIALIDTGVDIEHEDLQDAIWLNEKEIPDNRIDDDGNGYVDDVYGWDFYNGDSTVCSYARNGTAKKNDNDNHGTHCAGIIAAKSKNNDGMVGVASNVNAKIMVCKALGGSNSVTDTVKVIEAINYAMANGAQMINASWGGDLSKTEDTALRTAIKKCGLLIVAAAGNEGENNNLVPCYPASYNSEYDNIISVGSIDCDGEMSDFSNYGSSVDVLAPGRDIYSTVVGGYKLISGTSMATPFVSGIAAMLIAEHPGCYAKNIREVLLQSYTPLDTVSGEMVKCPGIISAEKAIDNRSLIASDLINPKIENLSSDYKGKIKVKAKDEGGSGLLFVMYAYKKRKKEFFAHGTKGTYVERDTIKVKKSGIYTFFACDKAGNETVAYLHVNVDVTKPEISVKKKNAILEITVKDNMSGIQIARYAYGKRTKTYMRKGKQLKIDSEGIGNIKKRTGYVTIYAKDKVGNETCKYVKIK